MITTNSGFLIIGGATKCGTTSLFKWLGDHPVINRATFKESRFFLPPTYPLPTESTLWRDGEDAYARSFPTVDGAKWCLEATSDYLFCRESAEAIAKTLFPCRVIFLLRDPIDRLYSWYRFAKQRAMIKRSVTFADYVAMQRTSILPEQQIPQHLRALEQGRYYRYLTTYWQVLGRPNVSVLFFEDIASKPNGVMRSLCNTLEIDSSFYTQYSFQVMNRTGEPATFPRLTGIRRRIERHARHLAKGKPTLHRYLQKAYAPIAHRYVPVNPSTAACEISRDDVAALVEYYQSDNLALANDLERDLPWPHFRIPFQRGSNFS